MTIGQEKIKPVAVAFVAAKTGSRNEQTIAMQVEMT